MDNKAGEGEEKNNISSRGEIHKVQSRRELREWSSMLYSLGRPGGLVL
jgi:hypothetical protein